MKKNFWLSRINWILVSAVAYFAWYVIHKPITFREEVQLSNGTIVEVDRSVHMQALGEIGGPNGSDVVENSFKFVGEQHGRKIPEWRSDSGLVPMVLDFDAINDEWFLVATFFSCEAWSKLGRPVLPYAEFRQRNNLWLQVPLEENLIGMKANVLLMISSKKELEKHTISTKNARDEDPRIAKEYKVIVKKYRNHC